MTLDLDCRNWNAIEPSRLGRAYSFDLAQVADIFQETHPGSFHVLRRMTILK